MTKEEFEAVQAGLLATRSQRVATAFGTVPASIPHLAELIERVPAEDQLTADALYSLLFSECSKAQNEEIYLHYLRKRCAEDDTNIMALASSADTFSVIAPDSDDALKAATKALALAKAQDRLVRYCATNLARIALRLDKYEYLELALRNLISDAKAVRLDDSPYAFDFVEQIDSARCDRDLVRQYKALT